MLIVVIETTERVFLVCYWLMVLYLCGVWRDAVTVSEGGTDDRRTGEDTHTSSSLSADI